MVRLVVMCMLQEPPVKPLKMSESPVSGPDKMEKLEKSLSGEAKNKKAKKKKKTPTAGIEVIETLEEAPVKQINPEPALEQHAGFMCTPSEIDTMVQTANQFSFPHEKLKTVPSNLAMPGPSSKGQPEYLQTYVELMFQDMLGVDLVPWKQPDLDRSADLEQVALQECLIDDSKPLHTNLVLPHQGLTSTCPVYFGSLQNKQKVLDALCNEIHTKVLNQWGTLACHYGLLPILKLSQTPRNLNKVFLSCPKTRETRCGYFQWVHRPPKPNYIPKTASRSALKKRFNDMVQRKNAETS